MPKDPAPPWRRGPIVTPTGSDLTEEPEDEDPDAGGTEWMGGALSPSAAAAAQLPAEAALARPITFKERYYYDKFGMSVGMGIREDDAVLRQLIQSYVEALQWVMLYYYRG